MNTAEAITIQRRLIANKLLPGAADGQWGPLSQAALEDFQILTGTTDELGKAGSKTKEKLELFSGAVAPSLKLDKSLVSRIAAYMVNKKYVLYTGAKRLNLVGIEGMNTNGTVNRDQLNEWNDTFLIFEVVDAVPRLVAGPFAGSTEPGRYYRLHRLNPDGAFQIALDQHQFCWRVGTHKGYEALSQTGPGLVWGYRDRDADGLRTGDPLAKGYYGINLHHGWNSPKVDKNSAGCQVICRVDQFLTFMSAVKSDCRYRLNKSYPFTLTVIDGSKL